MARCIIYGPQNQWVESAKPDINVTRSGFDTATLHMQKAVSSADEKVSAFDVGGQGSGPFSNMYITASQITESIPGLFNATVTYTGLYQSSQQSVLYQWLSESRVRPKQLFKPVQTSMRCYADEIAERNQAGSNYILAIPRLTVTEEYVTEDYPDNSEIGKEGDPLQPPSEVSLPPLPNSSAFDKIPVAPNGWILNTRSWIQVLDKPLFHVTDEWQYRIPYEYVNPPAE